MMRRLAALALLAPLAAAAAERGGAARLQVSATVVRSVTVGVGGGDGATIRLRTPHGATWSATLAAAALAPGVSVAPSEDEPGHVVVTVLADAPLGALAASR
jgi:hypothetical protein